MSVFGPTRLKAEGQSAVPRRGSFALYFTWSRPLRGGRMKLRNFMSLLAAQRHGRSRRGRSNRRCR
jgi:hypothetical protein